MITMNWDSGEFRDMDVDSMLEAVTASAAEAAYQEGDGVVPEAVDEITAGASFVIPLLIPEEVESGDGRKMAKDALSVRDLPIPLLWQPQTGDGHNGSYIVGRIDTIDRVENGLGNARGVFDSGPYGREAERLVREKMLRGVSADLDQFEATVDGEEVTDISKIISEKMTVDKARVMAATLVAKPAFQQCTIELATEEDMTEEVPLSDGEYTEYPESEMELAERNLSALAASAAPVTPPEAWFTNPQLTAPTPLTVDDDGRVYGHIATWETDHIAYNYGVKPPRSRSNYAYFRTGLVRTAEGTDVAVGQLTLAGGHAPLDADAHKAVQHYDDTASAIADVSAGEDQFGIWVSGGLRPGTTPEQVRTLRASAPSGDWRPINGALELVAVCQVNVPGFPVARARVASGSVVALVAAGTTQLAKIKTTQIEDLAARIDAMEKRELAARKAELASRFEGIKEMRRQRLIEAANAARDKIAPEIARRAEMASRAEEARKRVAEFKLGLSPKKDWDPDLHPRDKNGKFRHVLLKLSDLLNGDDDSPSLPSTEAAKASLERAADLEEQGDIAGAKVAADEAREALEEASRDTDGNDMVKARLHDAAVEIEQVENEIDDIAPEVDEDVKAEIDADSGLAPEEDDVAAPVDVDVDIELPELGEIPQEIQDLIDLLIDEVGENVDPKAIISRMDNQLRHWLEGKGFESPEDMARVIMRQMEKEIQPDIGQ